MTDTENTVLISGAGVAGPALAYWLHQYGYSPTIVERAPTLRAGGYAVDFRGTAQLTVLERMGLLDEIRRHQTRMGPMLCVDDTGRRLASLPSDIFSGDIEILRGDLTRVLYEATKTYTEYIFDDSLTDLAQDQHGVSATFENGPSRGFGLVIGADGLHSTTRRLAFDKQSAHIRHLGYYSAIFTTANHLDLRYTGELYNVPGREAGLYSARDNTEAKAMFGFASSPLEYDYRDTDQQKRIVAERFADMGWEVPRLLDAMWAATDFYFDAAAQIDLDRWSIGRVGLLGDAAWAPGPGGNGTGMAVVGAYILAGELANGDHRTAFARYEELMRGYVRENQKQAQGGAGFLVPQTRSKIWLRNLMYRTLPYLPWKRLIPKLARRTANAIELPDCREIGYSRT